jgi:hypothetical protein
MEINYKIIVLEISKIMNLQLVVTSMVFDQNIKHEIKRAEQKII